MTIEDLIDNFSLLEDWEDRYRYLIDLGNRLPSMDEMLKTEQSRVRGCMSQVWMVIGWDAQGRLSLFADSDAQIVRGLIAILRIIFHGKTAKEAGEIDVDQVFKKLALDQHLSPNRRNGFYAMVGRIRSFIEGDR